MEKKKESQRRGGGGEGMTRKRGIPDPVALFEIRRVKNPLPGVVGGRPRATEGLEGERGRVGGEEGAEEVVFKGGPSLSRRF